MKILALRHVQDTQGVSITWRLMPTPLQNGKLTVSSLMAATRIPKICLMVGKVCINNLYNIIFLFGKLSVFCRLFYIFHNYTFPSSDPMTRSNQPNTPFKIDNV